MIFDSHQLKQQLFKTTSQLIKFGIVGVINTLITLTTIFVLSNYLNVYYIYSNCIGYLLGFINSFVMNKFWTFQSQGNIYKESLFFLLVFLVCYIIQLSVLYYLHGIRQYNENLSQLISMVVYTLANFLLNKFLTFK